MCEWIAGEARRARTDWTMIVGMANGADAARKVAHIRALVVNAGLVQCALGIDHALGPTVWRRSQVAELARAHRLAGIVAAVAVRAARRRIARILVVARRRRGGHLTALEERIAGQAGRTRARWHMIRYMAHGQRAANADARIGAFVADAGQAVVALVADLALAATSALLIVGVALEAFVAIAGAGSVAFAALGVRSAR